MNPRVGQPCWLRATFVVEGDAADPTTVTFRVKFKSTGVIETLGDVVHVSTGVWRARFTPSVAGRYAAEVQGDDPAQGLREIGFEVDPSSFPPLP